jgi:hypothetical protein
MMFNNNLFSNHFMRASSLFSLLLLFSFQTFAQNHKDIDTVLDNWHIAAAQANADKFFGSMTEGSIYIGTDSSERWTKTQFIGFAKPYFDKGKAWDFKPFDRDVHVSADGKHAWFSELLTTWMGVCRGSGILTKTKKGWQIEQYHLSVTVPNDLIRDFISLVENFNKQKPK